MLVQRHLRRSHVGSLRTFGHDAAALVARLSPRVVGVGLLLTLSGHRVVTDVDYEAVSDLAAFQRDFLDLIIEAYSKQFQEKD
jgi:hypothetical protein